MIIQSDGSQLNTSVPIFPKVFPKPDDTTFIVQPTDNRWRELCRRFSVLFAVFIR